MAKREADLAASPATVTVRGHHPFVLEDASKVWVVESGSAAVFSAQIESGIPVGHRRLLFEVSAGDLLLSISRPSSAIGAIALAVEELTLLERPLEEFVGVDSSADGANRAAIERWAERLCGVLGDGVAAATDLEFPTEGALEIAEGQTARLSPDETRWIRVDDGEVILAEQSGTALEPSPLFIPVGNRLGLCAPSGATLYVANTAELSAGSVISDGLHALHRAVAEHLRRSEVAAREDEISRLKRREAAQKSMTQAAMDDIGAVLNPQPSFPHRETPLLTAAAIVGDAMGIEIRPPTTSENMERVKNALHAIARASQVRYRRVLLRTHWWNDDCGPLIGYWDDGDQPVALLPTGESGYEVVDPETRARIPVDPEIDQRLAPEAVMLYAPLPAGKLAVWQLATFSVRGRGVDIAFLIGLSLIVTVIGMLTPMATALIMDTAIPDSNRRLLVELGLGLIAASFGIGLLSMAKGIVAIRTSTAADAATQAAVWDRLLRLRASFFQRYSSGDMLARASAVGAISQELNGTTLASMLASLMAAMNLVLLLYYSSSLAMIAVGMAAVTAVVTVVGGMAIRRFNLALMEMQGKFFGLVVQMIRSATKIRVAGAEDRAFALWATKYAEQLKLNRRAQKIDDYVTVLNQALPAISTMLLFWFGAALLDGSAGEPMSVGVFLAFNTALGTFIGGTTTLSNAIVDSMDMAAKSKRIRPILDEEPESDPDKSDPGKLRGNVGLSNVCFRYAADGPMILEGLSLQADPGEFIALAGPSGSGKSTIFRLLLGFETPESGIVTYDDQEMSGLDPTAVRRQLGVVLQSGVLNAGSMLDNIGVGGTITMEEAWEAAEDSALADDIRAMPMQMHTMVSEGGSNLSGGQRQRLLIARALVLQPRILLMDEATSALDNRTQAIVSDSLERRNVTRIVIAHRLSTIRSADRIYVLDRGRVVQAGTFDELVAEEGVFQSLMARQQT